MPVLSTNGLRFAAMADVGEVFSLMKFSVVPAKRRHGSLCERAIRVLEPPPHAPSVSAAPAVAPVARS
jgi:hypothetical protein